MNVLPGQPCPPGAVCDGFGTNSSLFPEPAEGVTLCLFDEKGREPRIYLPEVTGCCRHGDSAAISPSSSLIPMPKPSRGASTRILSENPDRSTGGRSSRELHPFPRQAEAVFPHTAGKSYGIDNFTGATQYFLQETMLLAAHTRSGRELRLSIPEGV